MASSSPGIRCWRTAFLTLRDETLASPPPPALLSLLRSLVLSHPANSLAAAAAHLPLHEVASDVVLLAESAVAVSKCPDADDDLLAICHLIHDIICSVRLELNSPSWIILQSFLEEVVNCSFRGAGSKNHLKTALVNAVAECLEILRLMVKVHSRNSTLSERVQLVRILLSIVSGLHAELLDLCPENGACISANDTGNRNIEPSSLWDIQTSAFLIIGDVLSIKGCALSTDLWHSAVEVLRKVMDFLASKNLIIENSLMSRFYATIFHCLHLILSDPKGSLSGNVAGFVATLQMFFTYGLPSRLPSTAPGLRENNFACPDSRQYTNGASGRYRPPHLRRKEIAKGSSIDAQSSSDGEPSTNNCTSSDSDHSDNDVYTRNVDHFRSSKARLAAIVCIQDLCHADSKLLTPLWPLLLPENDVLQPRKYQATLMTSLVYDPIIKIRIEAASAIASMLEGHALVLSQVAEYKESSKCGSFTTLSSSLGQMLMQLHKGVLYLIQRESHSRLLMGLFKVLVLLISATPYARMPRELLPSVITSLCNRMLVNHAFKIEQSSLLVCILSCLGTAFSRSPSSLGVVKVLEEGISQEFGVHADQESNAFAVLLHCVDRGMQQSIRYEAFQALRAISHNYPSTIHRMWKRVSDTVYELLQTQSIEVLRTEFASGLSKGETDKNAAPTMERCVAAGIKVMDECLRAASGFKGADELEECKLSEIQHISNFTRKKRISSAPNFEIEGPDTSGSYTLDSTSGTILWSEVIEKHMPRALSHSSHMVRVAAITCFAGMTSAVFFSLTEEKRNFVISASVAGAVSDATPSVRSAACRAVGVIACFSQILSNLRVLNDFVQAVKYNTRDSLPSVRITAAWALANICDSLRHKVAEFQKESSIDDLTNSTISLLFESALQLTKDGDKIKSNAVRALGNLSRFIRFKDQSALVNETNSSVSAFCGDSYWLERMVQAFVSCVTTGNVKVQWNVCHALSNLFMNENLKLHDMAWAPTVYSILLLLLRDSSNYKIRIHAAVALAVPSSRLDYGSSFPDVVRGLQHVLESSRSDCSPSPSIFKYKSNLENQLAYTTLHVLGFVSSEEDQSLKDFLVKKSSILEEWLKVLCSFVLEDDDRPSAGEAFARKKLEDDLTSYVPNKTMLVGALKSLMDVYSNGDHATLAHRFEKVAGSLS